MASRAQYRDIQYRLPVGWEMQFAQLGQWQRKVTCIVCGTDGYPGGPYPNGWQASCLLGHPDLCITCGARFVKGGLAKHRQCRLHHACCGLHHSTQFKRLQSRLESANA